MPLQAAFTLNSNEIFGTIANMIISQEVFANPLEKHQTLVDKARIDGSMYGDKKLYYSTDALVSKPWGPSAGAYPAYEQTEANNLLHIERPADPEVQDITLNRFRMVEITIDNYLSKRAWSTEGAFSQFNSVMLSWLRNTKRIYEGTLYNVFIGTDETSVGAQQRSVDITTAVGSATGIEAAQLEATEIARNLADLLVEMGDYSRDFNDYGFIRSYADANIKVVWNSKFVNKVRRVDLPTIYHKEGLVDKFEEDVLPERYFGKVQATAHTTVAGERAMDEMVIGNKHYFAGDVIETGSSVPENATYILDDKIICKVLVKLPVLMSGFEAGTSFFNPRSLTENHYLIWAFNTLEHFKEYPMITVRAI